MLVLKPGIPGDHLIGRASVPGLYIRFRDGIAEVKDDEMINLMKVSEGYKNGDFVAVDEKGEDPFAENRTPIEPVHVISELKYGHPEGRKVSEVPVKLPISVKKLIEAEAKKMAQKMFDEMVKDSNSEKEDLPGEEAVEVDE